MAFPCQCRSQEAGHAVCGHRRSGHSEACFISRAGPGSDRRHQGHRAARVSGGNEGIFMDLNKSRLAAAAIVIACIASSTPAAALEKVVLGLDWQALGRHAGFFTAKAKGFYEREGLDVDIQRGYGAADSVK